MIYFHGMFALVLQFLYHPQVIFFLRGPIRHYLHECFTFLCVLFSEMTTTKMFNQSLTKTHTA